MTSEQTLLMWMSPITLALLCAGCGPVPQPESNRTVAAFEIPLPTQADHEAFLQLLRSEAIAAGDFHVDADDAEELQRMSEVSPITLNASIWRGANDDEIVASAQDSRYNLRRVWLCFAKGEHPKRFALFRKKLMAKIVQRWPRTASLPILPSGAIPLPEDLTLTPSGYQLKATSRSKYR